MTAPSLYHLSAGIISLVWAWSGIAKLVNWSSFETALAAHDILPPSLLPLGWLVPAAELLIAVLLFPSPSPHAPRPLKPVAASLLLALAVSVYAWLIPAAALETVGCGCRGGVSHPMMIAGLPARPALLITDAIFLMLHSLPFLGAQRMTAARQLGPSAPGVLAQ